MRRARARAGACAARVLVAALTTTACAETADPTADAAAIADGSGPTDAGTPLDLVTPSGWTLLAPADDPWAAHLDPGKPCDPLGLKDEASFFEIDTRICAAASVAQPLAADIRAGDELRALVWHLDLVATGTATGHFALGVGDHLLMEELVPIPSMEKVYELRAPADFSATAGARVVFHVHNHGFNNWRIAYLRRVRRG